MYSFWWNQILSFSNGFFCGLIFEEALKSEPAVPTKWLVTGEGSGHPKWYFNSCCDQNIERENLLGSFRETVGSVTPHGARPSTVAVFWTCSVRLCKDVLQYLNEEIQPILCGEMALGGEGEGGGERNKPCSVSVWSKRSCCEERSRIILNLTVVTGESQCSSLKSDHATWCTNRLWSSCSQSAEPWAIHSFLRQTVINVLCGASWRCRGRHTKLNHKFSLTVIFN